MLDVRKITENLTSDYDIYTQKVIDSLRSIGCALACKRSLEECILSRESYTCGVRLTHKSKPKFLDNVWPVMIGSRLDVRLRKLDNELTSDGLVVVDESLTPNIDETRWHTADIAITLFLIKGNLQMIPLFITNDVTNVHVVRDSVVRLYRYNSREKGVELCLYMESENDGKHFCGDMFLRSFDGTEKLVDRGSRKLNKFFVTGQMVPDCKKFFQFVYSERPDIDHLGNKTVFSPGRIFHRLFRKTLYTAIEERDKNWKRLNDQHKIVEKSIRDGDLLHVISKKTLFYKEMQMPNKMIHADKNQAQGVAAEPRRELGADDQVFVEKKTTCYREAHLQCYQLIPYLSQTVFFQISSKVKSSSVLCFHDSYEGFLCPFGTSETRNVGRQMLLARDVHLSTEEDDTALLKMLEYSETGTKYVVVNNACIPVTDSFFTHRLDLMEIKRRFVYVECYVRGGDFAIVNYKPGVLFKRLTDTVFVTPNDMRYWMDRLTIVSGEFEFVRSYYSDVIPFVRHNAFPKNVLALNALKSSILAPTPEYSVYFRETVSAHLRPDSVRSVLVPASNEFSRHWEIRMPKLNVMFASFQGITQEDCIVVHQRIAPQFDCYKLSTIKFRTDCKCLFDPVKGGGSRDDEGTFLGQIVCHDGNLYGSDVRVGVQPLTMHTTVERVNDRVARLYFKKRHFRVFDYTKTEAYLFVTVRKKHSCANGDKMCSLAGQKGVVNIHDELFRVEDDRESLTPDLLVNPYSLIGRQTMGQIKEMSASGGRDYPRVYNHRGKLLETYSGAFVGRAFYFPINYHADEHVYVATDCVKDKITGQPVRGRSRQGGMKAGNMEITNGFRGCGLASCFEEKLHEHSDRIITEDAIAIPKSVYLCTEDAKIYKSTHDFECEPLIVDVTKKKKKRGM